MKRNPHPARGSRITTLGVSATAFVSIVTSLAWNTHQAELVASVTDSNTSPVQLVNPDPSATIPAASSATPAATIAPAAPAKKSTAPAPAKKNKTSAPAQSATPAVPSTPAVAPAAPAAPAAQPAAPAAPVAPTTPAVAPAAPAPTVVYTCMSPGGKTENPTSTGKCKNAKYGYVLTQI